ncbi:MAG TPA: hypothetical protein VGV35_04770 [Bryobacteraceae bacterium]|nr:hypothetical protein [Bryobacteraceae bacterium]
MSYIEYVTSEPEAENLLPDLAKANRFTMEELALNRAGKIADGQMLKLAAKAVRPIKTSSSVLLGWLIFLFVIYTFIPGLVIRLAGMWLGKSLGALFAAITLGCVISVLAGLWRSGRMTFGLFGDLSKGVAAMIEGRVAVSRDRADIQGMSRLYGEKDEVYHYVLNNQYFEVDQLAFEALASRQNYRLYFAPRSGLLLSIEASLGAPPKPKPAEAQS